MHTVVANPKINSTDEDNKKVEKSETKERVENENDLTDMAESNTASDAKSEEKKTIKELTVEKDGEFHTGKHKKRKFIIEYHREICIGAASCAAIAPLTFEMDEENKAYIVETGDWDEEELILAAAQSCPVFAIIIKDAETGEQIFPEVF